MQFTNKVGSNNINVLENIELIQQLKTKLLSFKSNDYYNYITQHYGKDAIEFLNSEEMVNLKALIKLNLIEGFKNINPWDSAIIQRACSFINVARFMNISSC